VTVESNGRSSATRSTVELEGLHKSFGAVRAVDGIDLVVGEGEILALLGPSGCGKTTTLRLIAGFDRPDAGRIVITGEPVAGEGRFVPAERRRIGVVFQDYALFPHLTVAQNVGYGVRDRQERPARVRELLELVGLADNAGRMPHELSGGQQQRVALARALAPRPALVLLDEPFSNLDAALRVHVRAEVRSILLAANATAVFVTHDQEEALSLADRVAVMNRGRVLQTDSPSDLYANPADRFVATFVGDADLLPGSVHSESEVHTAVGALRATGPVSHGDVEVVLRPERVRLRLDGGGQGVVREIVYFGHDQLVEVALEGGERVRSRMGPGRAFEPGDRVSVAVTGDVIAFPRASTNGE
jgi:iron(III) transport system ATP-binding protein